VRTINETSRATGSRWGAVQAYWVDEGTAPTASRPKFGKFDLKLAKIAALGYDTGELEQDATAFQSVMTTAFADELTFMVEDAVYEGDGAGKPLGILNAPALVSVSKESGQAAATIVTKNLSKMWARFTGRNPVWFINRDVNPSLDELSIPAGTGALEPRFVVYGSDGLMRIKGAPVVEIEYAATLGTVGDIMLADMSAYSYIDGGGVKQAQSMHVAFTTDEMAFRATMRCDGQVTPRAALTPFKGTGTTTLSPFVVLATRA
jgi:HK97 family phage major capsid protein